MVTEATINKNATALLTHYLKRYEEKYGGAPRDLNRHRDKWGFRAMYEDLGVKQGELVIDYFFRTPRPGHPIKQLFNNYDRINEIMQEQERDEVERLALRKETEERVRLWEEGLRNGNK